jgi:glyoxylase-like metal-dependent hydrolase (beta-lactamase superfamily II)
VLGKSGATRQAAGMAFGLPRRRASALSRCGFAMRIHHLNCISSCPLGGRLMDGETRTILERGHLCCHCLLVEGEHGLALVDTGFGLGDVADPSGRLSHFFLTLLRPAFRAEMTAVRQIERLGFAASDVKDIVLTHLDFDHAGGLDDFPQARVHLMAEERDTAVAQRTWMDRQRFRPQQWASSRPRWTVYSPSQGEGWFGFDCVRDLPGLSADLLLVPLRGHTFGHVGVAVRSGGRWLLLAGDAYFHHGEMHLDEPWCTPGLLMYQTMLEKDRPARLRNQQRLRDLRRAHGTEIDIFSAHDNVEFRRLSGRSPALPADAFATA